jgi:hypothetical protein
MDYRAVIERLGSNAVVIRGLSRGIPPDQARWKKSEEDWSLLDVINHLHDEEIEDFRIKLERLFKDPEKEWPPIDPKGWVVQRAYDQRELETSLKHFLEERERSISWLESLDSPDWELTHDHPRLGRMSAMQLLVNWLAHDLIHIRQLTELLYAYLSDRVRPISLRYAGEW